MEQIEQSLLVCKSGLTHFLVQEFSAARQHDAFSSVWLIVLRIIISNSSLVSYNIISLISLCWYHELLSRSPLRDSPILAVMTSKAPSTSSSGKVKPKPTTEIDFFAALLAKSNQKQPKQSKQKKPPVAPVEQLPTSSKLTKYNAYVANAPVKKRKKPTTLKKKILHVRLKTCALTD